MSATSEGVIEFMCAIKLVPPKDVESTTQPDTIH